MGTATVKAVKKVILVASDSSSSFVQEALRQLPDSEFTVQIVSPDALARLSANGHYDYHVVDADQLAPETLAATRHRLSADRGVVVGGPRPHDSALGKTGIPSIDGANLPEIFENLDKLSRRRGTLRPRQNAF